MTDSCEQHFGTSAARPGAVRSVYRTMDDFERAVRRAAARLGRRGAVPHERELLLFCCFIVAALALNEAAAIWGAWPYGNLVTWRELLGALVLVGAWLAWYLRRYRREVLSIIERRRCFECGQSLLEVPISESGDGACPRCARSFNLGMYHPPTGCIEALQQARERTANRYPRPATTALTPVQVWIPWAVEDDEPAPMTGREREALVARAADRVVLRERRAVAALAIVFVSWLTVLVMAGVFGHGAFLVGAALMLPVTLAAAAYINGRCSAARLRMVGERRCLGCASPLAWPPEATKLDSAVCRSCGRIVMAGEYERMPEWHAEPPWRSLKAAIVNPSLAMPPFPPPADAGMRGESAGSILVARLLRVVRAVRRRLRHT